MRLCIDTADPEEAHDWLRTAYVDHSARLSGRREDFRFQHRLADCGSSSSEPLQHTMTLQGDWARSTTRCCSATCSPADSTSGRGVRRCSRRPVTSSSTTRDVPMSVHWSDIRMANVRIPRAAFDRVAATLVGDDRTSAPVGFDLAQPLSKGKAMHWKRLMQYVNGDVTGQPGGARQPAC